VGLKLNVVWFATYLALEFLDAPDLDLIRKPPKGDTDFLDLCTVWGNDAWWRLGNIPMHGVTVVVPISSSTGV
jgi:hypothetical protein